MFPWVRVLATFPTTTWWKRRADPLPRQTSTCVPHVWMHIVSRCQKKVQSEKTIAAKEAARPVVRPSLEPISSTQKQDRNKRADKRTEKALKKC